MAIVGVRFSLAFVCLSVYQHDISKTNAARFAKLDKEMFTMCSGNPYIFGSKGQRSRSQGAKKQCQRGFCTLVSAGFF